MNFSNDEMVLIDQALELLSSKFEQIAEQRAGEGRDPSKQINSTQNCDKLRERIKRTFNSRPFKSYSSGIELYEKESDAERRGDHLSELGAGGRATYLDCSLLFGGKLYGVEVTDLPQMREGTSNGQNRTI